MMDTKKGILKSNILELILFLTGYFPAVIFADFGIPFVSFIILALLSVLLYAVRTINSKCVVEPGALLLLSWTMGLALSILRLSKLHTPWTVQSKICFGLLPVGFLLGDALASLFDKKKKDKSYSKRVYSNDRLLLVILFTSIISAAVFFTEAIILGYIPAFSKETHAYNYFHVTGLHYFTVSCMMTHALSAVYIPEMLRNGEKLKGKALFIIIFSNLLSLSIALMCISKFQFLLIIGLPVLIILGRIKIYDFKKLPWRNILFVSMLMVSVFAAIMVVFTKLRHYEPGYLDSIFEFRNPRIPGFIQYIYMYIANNYANFNNMTENLVSHSYGLKELFPVFALTGTKFIFPQLVSFPLFVVKEEINTLTLIYDAYYDFGVAGVAGFSVILGLLNRWICKVRDENKNPVFMLFYAQFALYMALSFFSAWYTVPTTWFWFAITGLFCILVMKKEV